MIRYPLVHPSHARVMSFLSVNVIFIVLATVAVLGVSAQQQPAAHRNDLVAVEMGGRVERVSSHTPVPTGRRSICSARCR